MAAFIGNIFFEVGDGASPVEAFTRVCQVFAIDGFGATNALEEATTMCSGGSREYIAGLADGAEFSIECNYEQDDAGLAGLRADVVAKATKNYQIVVEQNSPNKTFSFAAVPLSWVINPSVDGRNTITFGFKISGAITEA